MTKVIIPTLLLLVTIRAEAGSSAIGTTAAESLTLGAGARSIAMGGAYSAAADEASALYWNPADMTQVPNRSVTFMHTAYLASTSYDYGAYVHNLGRYGAWGAGIQYFSFGSVATTDESFNPTGTISPYDMAASLGYAYKFSNGLSLGMAGKFIKSNWANSAQTEALDFGLLSPRCLDDRLKLALTVQNLGQGLKYGQAVEPLPLAVKAGSAYRITSNWLATMDLAYPKYNSPYVNMGTEYLIVSGDWWRFAGRAGFSSQNNAPSFGIGAGYRGLSVDYAFVPYGDLGDAHRISLTYNF